MSAKSPMQGNSPIDHYWEDENFEPSAETLAAARDAMDRIRRRQSMLHRTLNALGSLGWFEWVLIWTCMFAIGFSLGIVTKALIH